MRMTKLGENLDPAGFAVPIRGPTQWDGTNFIISRADVSDLDQGSSPQAVRISEAGTTLDNAPIAIPSRNSASGGNQTAFFLSSERQIFDTNLQLVSTNSTAETP